MQDEVNEKIIALCVQTTRMSTGVLKASMRKFLDGMSRQKQKRVQVKQAVKTGKAQEKGREKERKRQEMKKPHGKQTIKQLIAQGAQLTNIQITDQNTYGGEAKRLLEDLQSRNERMFLVTALFLNTAKSKQELENAIFQTAGIAQKYNCMLKRLDYQQEEGLMSSLPLGVSHIPIKRALTTTSTAIFVPFTTQELFMGGDSLYYGLNATSNNLIMVDRKKSKNPNGLILGTPGSGKSFAAKREMTNVFFTTNDDIIIGDPEGEYYPLVHALGGQVIHISPNSKDYINPMDINMNYSEDDNPLGVKSDFILSLCELIMGSRDGIEAEEKSVIDRCLPLVYQNYFSDPKPENMPILGDLYDCLRKQKEPQAQRIATALEIYVNGSLKVFNHQTNVELNQEYHRQVAYIILDSYGKMIMEECKNGFDEKTKQKLHELMKTPEQREQEYQKYKERLEHYQKFFENGTYERSWESGTEENYNMVDGQVNNLKNAEEKSVERKPAQKLYQSSKKKPKKRESVIKRLREKQIAIAVKSGKPVPRYLEQEMERRRD